MHFLFIRERAICISSTRPLCGTFRCWNSVSVHEKSVQTSHLVRRRSVLSVYVKLYRDSIISLVGRSLPNTLASAIAEKHNLLAVKNLK